MVNPNFTSHVVTSNVERRTYGHLVLDPRYSASRNSGMTDGGSAPTSQIFCPNKSVQGIPLKGFSFLVYEMRIKAENCLRPLFAAEFFSAPYFICQKTLENLLRSRFLWLLSFGDAKESNIIHYSGTPSFDHLDFSIE